MTEENNIKRKEGTLKGIQRKVQKAPLSQPKGLLNLHLSTIWKT